MRGECLQIGPDLVADVAIGGHPVGSDDHQVHPAMLHQMAAGVVGDHRMWDAVVPELPGGERGTLVTGPGLIDPNVNGDPTIMRQINRRRRGSPVHRREPAGVTMGEDVDRFARSLRRLNRHDHGQAVAADALVDRHVLLRDLGRAGIGRLGAP